jgi:hypothetical protein
MVADGIGVDKDSIKSPFWGEARRYRHAIAHENGIGDKHTQKCLLLPPTPIGQKIKLTPDFIVKYMDLCRQSIIQIKNEYKRA